jgi:hypothetical protein
MDARTLVVGQEVYMFSGVYAPLKGKVAMITPEGVDVQTDRGLFRFDKDGKELYVSRRERLGFGPNPNLIQCFGISLLSSPLGNWTTAHSRSARV